MRKYIMTYKYLSIVFCIGYYIFVIIDDLKLIKEYWETSILYYLFIWTSYFIVFFIYFSIFYWLVCIVLIFIKKYVLIK